MRAASPFLAGVPLRDIYDNMKPSATTRPAGAVADNFLKDGLQKDRIPLGFQHAINITGGEDVGHKQRHLDILDCNYPTAVAQALVDDD